MEATLPKQRKKQGSRKRLPYCYLYFLGGVKAAAPVGYEAQFFSIAPLGSFSALRRDFLRKVPQFAGNKGGKGIDRLARQQGEHKHWQGNAQEYQGIVFRAVPLGHRAVNPYIKESGKNIALEHAAGEPGQRAGARPPRRR